MGWLSRSCCYQLVFLQFFLLHSSLTHSKLCSNDQASLLLHFKQLFTDNYTSYDMMQWKEDTDCCSWYGVTCDDMGKGHVTGLDLSLNGLNGTIPSNSTLFLLPYLKDLDLSHNPSLKGSLPEANWSNPLQILNVSYTSFSGRLPDSISNLKSLTHLDVFYTNFSGQLPNSIGNLKSLTQLYLQHCKFIGSVPASIGNLTQLEDLDLSYNNFTGNIPSSLSNLHNLSRLDLSVNNFIGEIPEIFVNLTQLYYLNLSRNQLFGPIPSFLSELQILNTFELANNFLKGAIPSSLFTLPLLETIRLSFNQLEAIDIGENLSHSLQSISLDNNRLHGSIPSSIFELENLISISLSSNNLSGNLEPYMFAKLTNLQDLDLSSNNFSGNLEPYLFAKLQYLEHLDLSSNNFSGNLEPYLFANLTTLQELDLSHNSLSLSSTIKVNSSFEAPSNLKRLDLSDNKIHGTIPNWMEDMGKDTLRYLNLSHNFIKGGIDQLPIQNNLGFLDLRSNLLQGKLPFLPPGLYTLLISKNQLTGEIPHCICNMSHLRVFDLSNNNMSGTIPECMGNISSYLKVIDLQHNSFSGTIPDTFEQNYYLETLNFNNNDLEGPVPRSLVNCTTLQVLDLGNNKINDTFPHWLGILPDLQVLVLCSNKFSGSVRDSMANNSFSKLRILDLSKNNFSGSLPIKYFGKLKAMMNVSEAGGKLQYMYIEGFSIRTNPYSWVCSGSRANRANPYSRGCSGSQATYISSPNRYSRGCGSRVNPYNRGCSISEDPLGVSTGIDSPYQYSIVVTMKGVDIHMEKILTIFTTMDFSCNKFQGQIPDVVGKLKFLKVLNFSHNDLIGHIPLSFENLTELESLDLSSNRLEGEIPKQLTSLTSLSSLNLSYNQLVGHIPQGNQFGTFQNDSYIGNLGLCDFPLSKKCNNCEEPECKPDTPTIFHDEHDDVSWFDWKMSLMGYGSGLVIGLSTGYIVFSTRKPEWIVNMVDREQSRKVRRLAGRCRKT